LVVGRWSSEAPLLQISDLRVHFRDGGFTLSVPALEVRSGECVGILGQSGSGKSTLLRAIKGLVPIESGRLVLAEAREPADLSSGKAGSLSVSGRAGGEVALIYQQFHLVGRATVYENILVGSLGRVPSWRAALGFFPKDERGAAVRAALEVGLGDHLLARADRTSGGQQQRVAIARAIVQRAHLVLADEPVASLDPETGRQVLEVLLEAAAQHDQGLLISLHDPELARRYCSRIVGLRAGEVVFDAPADRVSDGELGRLYAR
jgi:phosphonate transport system ATP-binding protein